MQIQILDRQESLPQKTREFAERRLRFALSRFDPKIDRVSLVIADVNGPRGGVDKRCNITVKLRRGEPLHVSAESDTIEASIARALNKASRAVTRAVERSRTIQRTRLESA